MRMGLVTPDAASFVESQRVNVLVSNRRVTVQSNNEDTQGPTTYSNIIWCRVSVVSRFYYSDGGVTLNYKQCFYIN